MTTPSPPKPWERAGATATAPALPGASPAAAASATTASAPALPARPADLTSAQTVGAYGQQAGTSAYGASPYGATTSPYGSSAYSRYGGGYGSSMGSYGGGMSSYGMGSYGGGYGSSYGGYGGGYGMGGMGGMGAYGGGYGMGGMGMGGMPGMGMDGASLSQRMEAGTMATFQVIQSIVGAFGGFAQMLESTFMATHSSFFAMIGVAEQFGHLRNYLGQVLSIFALIRWFRSLLDRALGREPRPDLSADSFRAFESGASAAGASAGASGAGANAKPKLAKKPLIVFLLTVVGLPWLMTKLVRLITQRQEEEALRIAAANEVNGIVMGPPQLDQFGRPIPGSAQPLPGTPGSAAALDPATLTFVRATFPYEATDPAELSLKVDDIVAVLTPKAERTEPGWWRGRLRDGKIGWFPSTHVGDLPMKPAGPKKVDP